MSVYPSIEFDEKLTAQGCHEHGKAVVDIDFNGMGKYILKALDRHNGQTIGTPLYLLIFLYSTKGHYIHFIVVIIISSFIYESLLCRQLLKVVVLQCLAHLVKSFPIRNSYGYVQISCLPLGLIFMKQEHSHVPCGCSHDINWDRQG